MVGSESPVFVARGLTVGAGSEIDVSALGVSRIRLVDGGWLALGGLIVGFNETFGVISGDVAWMSVDSNAGYIQYNHVDVSVTDSAMFAVSSHTAFNRLTVRAANDSTPYLSLGGQLFATHSNFGGLWSSIRVIAGARIQVGSLSAGTPEFNVEPGAELNAETFFVYGFDAVGIIDGTIISGPSAAVDFTGFSIFEIRSSGTIAFDVSPQLLSGTFVIGARELIIGGMVAGSIELAVRADVIRIRVALRPMSLALAGSFVEIGAEIECDSVVITADILEAVHTIVGSSLTLGTAAV
jgi:hypothetical protein